MDKVRHYYTMTTMIENANGDWVDFQQTLNKKQYYDNMTELQKIADGYEQELEHNKMFCVFRNVFRIGNNTIFLKRLDFHE